MSDIHNFQAGSSMIWAQDQIATQTLGLGEVQQKYHASWWNKYIQPEVNAIDAKVAEAKAQYISEINAKKDAALAPLEGAYNTLNEQKETFYNALGEYLGFKSTLGEKPVLDSNGDLVSEPKFPWGLAIGALAVYFFVLK